MKGVGDEGVEAGGERVGGEVVIHRSHAAAVLRGIDVVQLMFVREL